MQDEVQSASPREFSDILVERIAVLSLHFNEYMVDGFKIKEVLRFFFECIDSLSDIGMYYTDIPEAQQRNQVVAALRKIYDANNPNIPWIMEPFESMMEQALFNYVVPELYTVLVKRKKAREAEAAVERAKAEAQPFIQ
jgi:hypothetical protein